LGTQGCQQPAKARGPGDVTKGHLIRGKDREGKGRIGHSGRNTGIISGAVMWARRAEAGELFGKSTQPKGKNERDVCRPRRRRGKLRVGISAFKDAENLLGNDHPVQREPGNQRKTAVRKPSQKRTAKKSIRSMEGSDSAPDYWDTIFGSSKPRWLRA